MANLLNIFVVLSLILPLIAAINVCLTFLIKASQETFETITFKLVRFYYVLNFFIVIFSIFLWFIRHESYVNFTIANFSLTNTFGVSIRLFFDFYSMFFLFCSSVITTLIVFFSHRYLHRDPGYRRFFIIISFFVFGIHLIILAGNFDLLFAGWEIVGLSSFLLIGYFWHRPKAIDSAFRAYCIYRVCDIGLLSSILITHFFWHDVSIFKDFLQTYDQSVLAHIPLSLRWLLSICLLFSVIGKSAQFPFCFWLPKAMEGPTHSSAIFYGSLSVHIGVFLLIRTMPIWYHTTGFVYLLGLIGLITAICATLFGLVQSNIKGQIGYASVAQVGIMLLELSFGLSNLAFFHMMGNAFLRCFQLLVSSSILTMHLHMQNVVRTFDSFTRFSVLNFFPKKINNYLYVFALNEGYFEVLIKKIFVFPTNFVASFSNKISFPFLQKKNKFFLLLLLVFALLFNGIFLIRLFCLFLSVFFVLASLGEKKEATQCVFLAVIANLFAFFSLPISFSGNLYLIGFLCSSITIVEAIYYISNRRTIENIQFYQGLFNQFPLMGCVLLMGILGSISFPFYATFFGEDILLNASIHFGVYHLLLFQIIFILTGICFIRLYSKIMLGKRDNYIDIDLDVGVIPFLLRIVALFLGNLFAYFITK